MDSTDDLSFKIIFSGDGAGRLRDRVREKLKEFMGDYTYDTLVVRAVCKPLKAFGIHKVSLLHSRASVDHQVHGLKSCEPEFLICTPDINKNLAPSHRGGLLF
ncbi:hypothetical protein HanIR_Chr08g0346471 [Helianthus annuus]|nr:hypothetical protein HanIR_Chr08g0346471 [Helianthus annuus]